MKKGRIFSLVLCMAMLGTILLVTGCPRRGPAAVADVGPFPGIIAIVTNDTSQNEEEFRSAEWLVDKYGPDKIWHLTWPTMFMQEQEQMITILQRIAANSDVRALIINQSVPGTTPAVDRLRETRPDIFIVYCAPQEDPVDITRRADLILRNDDFGMGPAIARQAHSQGAQHIVHYSFPRHMSQVFIAGRRDAMREEALRLGLQFHDVTAPDPMGDAGIPGTQQFILEDIPRQVARFGENAAFFGTNCAMQTPMLLRVFEGRAITFAFGPAFQWNILNYGQITNQVRVEDAALQTRLVNYQNTVLQAQQQVENGLTSFLQGREQVDLLRESVAAANAALGLAFLQYNLGTRDFTTVLTAEQNLYTAQNNLAMAEGNVSTGLASLYEALGGGWQIRAENEFVPAATAEEMRGRTNWGELLPPPGTPQPATPALPTPADVSPNPRLPEW